MGCTCKEPGETCMFCTPREPQKDETPKCPECSGRMLRVRNNSEFINNDQFDAIKRGDWFCVGQSVFAPKAAKHEAVYVWEEPREPHAALIAEIDEALADRYHHIPESLLRRCREALKGA